MRVYSLNVSARLQKARPSIMPSFSRLISVTKFQQTITEMNEKKKRNSNEKKKTPKAIQHIHWIMWYKSPTHVMHIDYHLVTWFCCCCCCYFFLGLWIEFLWDCIVMICCCWFVFHHFFSIVEWIAMQLLRFDSCSYALTNLFSLSPLTVNIKYISKWNTFIIFYCMHKVFAFEKEINNTKSHCDHCVNDHTIEMGREKMPQIVRRNATRKHI